MGTPGSPLTRLMAVLDKWAQPTRRPADLLVGQTNLVGGSHNLLKTFQKIPQTTSFTTTLRLGAQDKISVDYDQSRSTGYGKMCNVDLGLLVVTDQKSGNRPHPLANIRQTRRPLYNHTILKQSTPTTGRRVLLSGGPNQYKLVVFSVFRILVRNLRVLSLRLFPAEQLNHKD
jgi:hypothetical protein